jgi:hypothetical protein
MLGRWLLGIGLSLVLAGCKKPPAEYHYRLMLPGTDAPDHADLLLGEKKIGTFYRGDAKVDARNERSRGFAEVFLPATTTLAQHQGELSVVIQSASGSKRVPVKLTEGTLIYPGRPGNTVWSAEYEATRRKEIDNLPADAQMSILIDVPISLDLPSSATPSSTVTLWIDRHLPSGTPVDKQPNLTIGELTIPKGESKWVTDGLGSGSELPIAVDGKVIGKLTLDPKAKAYLISTEPACYRLDHIQYSSLKSPASAGPALAPVHFTGGKVAYALWSAKIGYFLAKAPSRERSASSTSQLSREPCAP